MFKRTEPRDFERNPEEVLPLLEEAGTWYTQIASTTVYQNASASNTGIDKLLNTSYSFGGAWEPINNGYISWWLRGGRPIGENRDTNLSQEIGAVLDSNASLESNALYLKELYWAHHVGESFRYSVGWIDSSYRYDFNIAANDDASAFLASPLVNSPTIPFPNSGVGADFLWKFNESLSIHAGIYQTNCDEENFECAITVENDELLAPIELIYSKAPGLLGTGNYRFLAFTTKENNREGSGWSVSIDQEIGRFIPFARVSSGNSEITKVKKFFSAGTVFTSPLGRQWDKVGIGYAHGKPSNNAQRDESMFELFWLLQLTPIIAVTPDVQVIKNPADNPDESRIWVVGARLQLDF